MEKEFINYNQALKLKELGFDEPCFGRYWIKEFQLRSPKDYNAPTEKIDSVSAPTYSQAFRFFREKYSLYHIIDKQGYWFFEIKKDEGFGDLDVILTSYDYETYEEAELACLDKLIEIVEGKSL